MKAQYITSALIVVMFLALWRHEYVQAHSEDHRHHHTAKCSIYHLDKGEYCEGLSNEACKKKIRNNLN